MIEPPAAHTPADASGARTPPPVVAVIPAWNRPGDLARLLGDLARIDRPMGVVVVDNGSDVALEGIESVAAAARTLRERHPVSFHRLGENLGGSGGFNAGIRLALDASPEFVWLIDSDARVDAGCLSALLDASGPGVAAAGASIADPATGRVFEVGGVLNRRTGRLVAQRAESAEPIEVDYAAACCLLVRAEAVRKAGLLPDLFLHSDDVSFCLRLRASTGQRIVAAPAARCAHPRFDRYKTWARYYEARNWIVPARDAGMGAAARFRRAWREVVLAAGQTLIGRDDLALLHLRGLRDAAAGRLVGRADAGRTRTSRIWPLHSLARSIDAVAPTMPESAQPIAVMHADVPLNAQWRSAIRKRLESKGLTVVDEPTPSPRPVREAVRGVLRMVLTPPAVVAVVNAKAPPHAWCAGRLVLSVSPGGYAIRRLRWADRIAALAAVLARGMLCAMRIAVAPPSSPASPAARSVTRSSDRRPTLSVIILTRDRVEALLHTLGKLRDDPVGRECEIVVVDNASSDGTPSTVRERFPDVHVVETGDNLGVEGFNRGVAASSGEVVLILDDDAWPAEGTLAGALDRFKDRPELDAIMLHRRHPRTDEWEWPFDRDVDDTESWPDMGSGNMIRRAAWDDVGGYEAGYFLYRNDTDLALKLLAANRPVSFARDLHVWHDSPIARRKTPRWIHRSTRNWVWLCKRHGGGGSGVVGILFGWLWAHRLARFSPAGHVAAIRGMIEGVVRPAPAMPGSVRADGSALRRLIKLKMRYRG